MKIAVVSMLMQHQKNTTTARDRYPAIFAEVQRLNPDAKRILSFGCSTGEEICTLQEYFPDAIITGVEINNLCLKVCKLKGLNVMHYLDFLQDQTEYDIIFAMSVLCRHEGKPEVDCKAPESYSFEQFNKEVSQLAEKLVLDGMLIVYNASYNITETTAYIDNEIMPELFLHESGFVPVFNADGSQSIESDETTIFVKI